MHPGPLKGRVGEGDVTLGPATFGGPSPVKYRKIRKL